jgi:arylsulfatase A-like enzyme
VIRSARPKLAEVPLPDLSFDAQLIKPRDYATYRIAAGSRQYSPPLPQRVRDPVIQSGGEIHAMNNRRSLPVCLALLAMCSLVFPVTVVAAPQAYRPNVLVMLADDAGYGDFSFVGNTNLATPVIDSLARDGAVLRQFMVQPFCSPTRAEFLTGRCHPRTGVRGVTTGQERMAADERTIAEVFHDAGYVTGCFGKWHNGTQWPWHPRARGFETFYGFTEGHWGDYVDPPLEHDGRFIRGSGYIVDALTTEAVAFMAASHAAGKPFFCYVPFNTPHSPMTVPDADWNRHREIAIQATSPATENLPHTRAALAMVENLDRNVGRLLAEIERLGLADDTIVVFFSDNGPNGQRWNAGLRGVKGSTDDGGVRSVCCLRYPGRIKPGTVVHQVTGAIDLLPTLAGLAGVAATPRKPLDGLDLTPLVCGEGSVADDRVIISRNGPKVSGRTTRFRLDAEGRLYDMQADPGQTRDLTKDEPAEAARLAAMVAAYRRDIIATGPATATEPFAVGHPGSPLTELPARDGKPRGDVQRNNKHANCTFFTSWTKPDDAIEWSVDVKQPGSYEVELWYTCPPGDAGSTVTLSCGGATLAATITPGWDPPLNTGDDRVPRVEGFDKEFRPLTLGKIDLPAGPATLRLQATQIPGRSVADVRRIVLVPARNRND